MESARSASDSRSARSPNTAAIRRRAPLPGVSVVCTLFPNVSFALAPKATMLSQLMPGPTPDRSVTVQTVFSMTPVEGDDLRRAETNAQFLYDVVHDEVRD